MADILRKAVDHADNFRIENDPNLWEFRVYDIDFPVGYIREKFIEGSTFNETDFKVDRIKRIITLAPEPKERSRVDAADDALIEFCEQNEKICPGFAPWIEKSSDDRDWHSIMGFGGDLKDLRVPTPSRGIFGLATAGIHCNFYSTKLVNGKEVIDSVWLSMRSRRSTFPSTPDNMVGGAMDPKDRMDPFIALRREVYEEAKMTIDADDETVRKNGEKCGELRGSAEVLSIATLKSEIAGPKEDGHIEFAIRYAFDICLVPGYIPRPNEVDTDVGSFWEVKVSDLATKAFEKPWKYSSGAVMSDFILRHNLMDVPKKEKEEFRARLRYQIPLENVKMYLK